MSLRPDTFCIRPKPIRETNNLPINFRRIGDGPLHAAAGKRNAGGTCSCLPAFRFPDSRLLRGLRFLDRWLAELAFDHGDLLASVSSDARARCCPSPSLLRSGRTFAMRSLAFCSEMRPVRVPPRRCRQGPAPASCSSSFTLSITERIGVFIETLAFDLMPRSAVSAAPACVSSSGEALNAAVA